MPKILVIDDDPDVLTVAGAILEFAGHTVLLAVNGTQALEQIRQRPIDLLITDLYMPGKHGLEIIQELRQLSGEIPVLAISGRPMTQGMVAAVNGSGPLAFLPKPFLCEQLLESVEKLLSATRPPAKTESRA